MVGKTLGHYEIREPLGAGGMGEVYLAHDPNLRRDVAIKVLPEMLADDPDRLARLEREAHSLAALNHPNVATIHGLESSDGIRFLVLELVEGETLQYRIARGPVPVDEALGLAKQIAEGLEVAHGAGIIHRDLKPANVKITPEGRVKVLDFGLAKASPERAQASGSDPGTDALTHSPTITAGATETGVLLGTAPYMSPEQAKGRPVDKRTDIWAFGCVLFEMLTGARPFEGEDVSEIIASILKEEPEWDALPPKTPYAVQQLLRRCLRKDLERRLRDIGDVRIEIEDAISEPDDAVPIRAAGSAASPSGMGRAIPWAVAAVATAVALGLYMQSDLRQPPTPVYSTVDIEVPPPAGSLNNNSPLVTSPDGSKLVYGLYERGAAPMAGRILRYDLNTGQTDVIVERAWLPFFSPDGTSIGFLADDALNTVRLDDGAGRAVPLCSTRGLGGASWGPDGRIVFSGGRTGLQYVNADGTGECAELTSLDADAGELSHLWPQVLPNGKGVIFSVYGERRYDAADVAVYSFETGTITPISTGTFARFVPTEGPDKGHLLAARRNDLWARPFDAVSLRTTGPEVPMGLELYTATVGFSGSAHFSVSDTGTLIYRELLPRATARRVLLVDLEGNKTPLLEDKPYETARFSPDGRELALITSVGEVYRYELEARRPTRILAPFNDAVAGQRTPRFAIEWAPDGASWILYTSGTFDEPIFRLFAGGDPVLLRTSVPTPEKYPAALLRDPARVLYYAAGSLRQVRELYLDSDEPERVLALGSPERTHLELSPDGSLLAWTADNQVWVQAYDGSSRERQVSIDGGRQPLWGGPESRTLYFRHADSFWAAEISTEPALDAGEPTMLFPDTYMPGSWRPRNYDLSPDGSQFVVIEEIEETAQTESFQMIQNFFQLLRERAPQQQ